MRTDKIIIIEMLSDPTYLRRQKHCRRVLDPQGIAVCIPAGCGCGGV